MKSPLVGLAVFAATASMAWAGGDEEKKAKAAPANSAKLEKLSLSETPAPQDKDLKVTGAPGKGITFSAGEDFELNLLSFVQARYRFESLDSDNPASNGGNADRSTFDIRRARTILSGWLYNKDITYKLQNEWTETTSIKDAWIQWMFWHRENNSIGMRMGQTKTYYGREATATGRKLDFVDRSVATRFMANSRSRGLQGHGDHMDGKFRWTAGLFNSDTAAGSSNAGEEASNPDNELNSVFSVRFDPNGSMGDESYSMGDLDYTETLMWSIGGGLQIGNHRAVIGGATRDVDGTDININAAMKYRGWHALADIYIRSDDPDVAGGTSTDSTGWSAGATYTMQARDGKPNQWGFGGRFSMLNLDDANQAVLTLTPLGASEGEITELTVVVSNYYRKHNLKTQLSWTLQNVDPQGANSATNHILEMQVTFAF